MATGTPVLQEAGARRQILNLHESLTMNPTRPSAMRLCGAFVFLVSLLLGPDLSAQTVRALGWPNGSWTGSFGNPVTLGAYCSSGYDESRTQILIPATNLPPRPCTLMGLDHIPVWLLSCPNPGTSTQVVDYILLELTVAHRPPGPGPLDTIFANNLVSSSTVVFSTQSSQIPWTRGVWNTIWFSPAFAYDGFSDVVIEIRRIVTPNPQNNVATLRNINSQRMGYQIQAAGPGASSAPQGTNVPLLGWRLRFDTQPEPTLVAASPANQNFAIGTTAEMYLYAVPNSTFALAFTIGGYLPASIPTPPANGGLRLNPSPFLATLPLGIASGPNPNWTRVNFAIPNAPCLQGLTLYWQAATIDPVTGRIDYTNATDFTI